MNKKTKSGKILTFLLLPLLFACENTPSPLSGEKISIFNSEITDENIEKRIVLEKPYVNKQWSSTGGNNENNVGHLAGKKQFKKLFSKSIGTVDDTNQILYRPVANKTTIFTIDGKLKITATNINTGKTIWEMERIKNNDLIKFGALALDDNYLYAITNSAQLLKLNTKTGEIAYSKYFNTPLKSGLQICGNKLFFINDSNELYIIDKQTGNKLYTHKSMEEASSFIKGSTPLCMDDKLVATFSNGEIHMLMSDTTTPIWLDSVYKISTSNLNNISDIVANPIATKGLVIVKGYNDITKALTLRDGKQIWENSNGGITTPIISNETMFDINKTIMRCLVKNLAMFGLGLYIYAGEDLPEGADPAQPETTDHSAQSADRYIAARNELTAAIAAYVESSGKPKSDVLNALKEVPGGTMKTEQGCILLINQLKAWSK